GTSPSARGSPAGSLAPDLSAPSCPTAEPLGPTSARASSSAPTCVGSGGSQGGGGGRAPRRAATSRAASTRRASPSPAVASPEGGPAEGGPADRSPTVRSPDGTARRPVGPSPGRLGVALRGTCHGGASRAPGAAAGVSPLARAHCTA